MSATPRIQRVIAGSGARVPTGQLIAVPILKVHAGTAGEVGDDLTELDEAMPGEITESG